MIAERFTLDSNILIYSIDHGAKAHHRMARRIIELAIRSDCWITLQAVSEFYAAATRKQRMPAAEAAAQAADWLEMFPCLSQSPTAVRAALTEAAAGRASFWDAQMLATPAEGGCGAILTEDMKDGAVLARVRVVNPFGPQDLTAAALSLLAPKRP